MTELPETFSERSCRTQLTADDILYGYCPIIERLVTTTNSHGIVEHRDRSGRVKMVTIAPGSCYQLPDPRYPGDKLITADDFELILYMEHPENETLHREDGPAIKASGGLYEEWRIDGKRQRDDGPAQIDTEGRRMWVDDHKAYFTEEMWLKAKAVRS